MSVMVTGHTTIRLARGETRVSLSDSGLEGTGPRTVDTTQWGWSGETLRRVAGNDRGRLLQDPRVGPGVRGPGVVGSERVYTGSLGQIGVVTRGDPMCITRLTERGTTVRLCSDREGFTSRECGT